MARPRIRDGQKPITTHLEESDYQSIVDSADRNYRSVSQETRIVIERGLKELRKDGVIPE